MPLTILAQRPPRITFEPAAGAERYEVRVRTRTEEIHYITHSATPEVVLGVLPPKPFWIDVRALWGTQGFAWSPFHWNSADADGNGWVGLSDFGVMMRRWGFYNLRDYAELIQHWGDQTQADSRGFRWYVEEPTELP